MKFGMDWLLDLGCFLPAMSCCLPRSSAAQAELDANPLSDAAGVAREALEVKRLPIVDHS